MDENTVLTDATVEETEVLETAQADAAPDGEGVVQETVEVEQADAAPERLFTKQEFDEAVRHKSKFLQKGLENDPYYQVAKALANQYGDMDPKEAAQKIIQDHIDKKAEELAKDPQALAKEVLKQRIPQPVDMAQYEARRIAADLNALHTAGELPQNFNLGEYIKACPTFLSDASEYGVKAAIKIASTQIAAIQRNQSLPQPTRPTNSAQPSPPNFKKMSAKDFKKFEREIDQAILEGKRVPF